MPFTLVNGIDLYYGEHGTGPALLFAHGQWDLCRRSEEDSMTIKDNALRVVAVLISVFGLIIVAGALIEIFNHTGQDSLASNITLLILIGILPLFLGLWLFKRTQTSASRRAMEARERIILNLAAHHGGVLTVPGVAEASGMTLEQSKEILNRLHLKGFNEMAVSESGTILYTFQL